MRPGARERRALTVLALTVLTAHAARASLPPPPEGADPAQVRFVHDASTWVAVKGPLNEFWRAWIESERAQGRAWDDDGHRLDLQGVVLRSSQRAEQVPAAAVAFMVSAAAEDGVLAGGDAGVVADLVHRERERAQVVENDALVAAAEAAAEEEAEEEAARKQAEEDEAARRAREEGSDDAAGSDGGEGSGDSDEDVLGGEDDGRPPSEDALDEATGGGAGSSDREDVPDLSDGDEGSSEGGDVFRDLRYGKQHDRQVLDLYLPEGDGPHPVVVFFHGGGFSSGDKDRAAKFRPVVARGYALASANYRLLKGKAQGIALLQSLGEIAKMAHDARRAVRWLKENATEYDLDPRRFAAVGASAGGYLAAMVGSASDVGSLPGEGDGGDAAVQAVVDWSGPTNFGTFLEHSGGSSFGGYASSFVNANGALNPWDFASRGDPPHLIRHGGKDPVIPVEQSTTYAQKLKGLGVPVDLKVYDQLGHSPDPKFLEAEVQATIDFLDRQLK